MMKQWLGCACLLATLSQAAWADTRLDVVEGITVTAIDGREINHGLFTPPKSHYVLSSGVHQVQARFDQLYDINSEQHDVVKSPSLTLPAVEMQDGQTYRLVMVNGPGDDYRKAKRFAKTPTFAIIDSQQRVLQQATGIEQHGPNLLTSAGQFASGVGQRVTAVVSGESMGEPTAMQKFKSLWQVATPEERRAMSIYMRQNPNGKKDND